MPNVLIVIEQDIFKKQFADKELKKNMSPLDLARIIELSLLVCRRYVKGRLWTYECMFRRERQDKATPLGNSLGYLVSCSPSQQTRSCQFQSLWETWLTINIQQSSANC